MKHHISPGLQAGLLNQPEKVDEFDYPPRVSEAINFIDSETAAYERKERQAERERRQSACPHEHVESVSTATMEDCTGAIAWCTDCGAERAA